ncbi:MAG: helix-turn-helix transcriptional regulator, partial [Eggerthella lenta]
LFCLLVGAVLGCIQGVGADLVLAHEQLAGGYVANNLLVAAALAIAAALVGGGAAFAHDGDDARLLAYARLTVIVALVLALCLANVLMMSGTFVSLTAAKLIGALLLAYAWFAACARPGARAVRALARMLVCWQVAAALLQAAVMAMAGEGPVQVVNVIVVILLGAVLVMQLFPLFLSSRPATFPTGPSNGQTRSQALSISADEADLALVERFADEYGLTPRERELLGFFAQGYSVAYASEQLVLSPYTVRTHLRNIYVKTDTHSRDDLLALLKTY